MLAAVDTIAAIATASGPAAIGIVRLSGPRAAEIASRVVGRYLTASPRRLSLATARHSGGAPIDQVLAVFMPGPRSFTGEDVAELHGHGGPEVLRQLLDAVVAAGARPAEPGEFSRRAFENGRIDLTQAEGIMALIGAGCERAVRVGQALLAGELGARVGALRARAVRALAAFEAEIDFPEDVEAGEHAAEVAGLRDGLAELVATARLGAALREGVQVALVGPTNAGKSSLFNRLIGRERALVAAEPGTTRDYVEASDSWDGLAVTLVDTAGTRSASGVEERGIELGRARASSCDLSLVIAEAGSEPPPLGERELLVWSKADLGGRCEGGIATSAVTGAGVALVQQAVIAAATSGAVLDERVVLVSARQKALAAEALAAAERAASGTSSGAPVELVAADLAAVRSALSRLLGEEVSDEMLDALFAEFCIGK